ncbi:MAG: radical SAM protein [Bacteroidales bacterium]|nr:radical SAM protein [Bacteroidales bacterium]
MKLQNHYWAKECGKNYFVFHESYGEPFLLTPTNFSRLKNNDIDPTFISELAEMGFFPDNRININCHAKSESYLQRYSGPIVLDLVISEACNLKCHMCSHAQTTSKSNTRSNTNKFMTIDVVKAWVNYYVDHYIPEKNRNKYIFHYGAAEPLLNKKVFIETLAYVQEKTIANGREVEQLVNSNLTLLDDEIIAALKQHSVKVSVGLDGLAEQNDLIRITKKGEGTFHVIVENITKLRKENISVGVALTITERNFNLLNPRKFLETMKNIGVSTVLVDSDFIHRIPVSAEDVTNILLEFYKIGEELSIEILGSWRTPFANLMTENDSEPKSFCTSLLGKNITVTPSGNISFCTYSGKLLANYNTTDIPSAVSSFTEKMKELMSHRLPTLNQNCDGCALSGLCNGGCYLTYEVTGSNNSMCDIYLNATAKLIDHVYGDETLD